MVRDCVAASGDHGIPRGTSLLLEGAGPDTLAQFYLEAAWSCRSLRGTHEVDSVEEALQRKLRQIGQPASELAMADPADGPKPLQRCLRDIRAAEALLASLPQTQPDRALHAAAAGIQIIDPGSRECVPRLLDTLDDARHWIRFNALRALRELSGERFGWKELTATYEHEWSAGRRAPGIARWRHWWKEQD